MHYVLGVKVLDWRPGFLHVHTRMHAFCIGRHGGRVSGCRVSGCRVQGVGCRVQGVGFKV